MTDANFHEWADCQQKARDHSISVSQDVSTMLASDTPQSSATQIYAAYWTAHSPTNTSAPPLKDFVIQYHQQAGTTGRLRSLGFLAEGVPIVHGCWIRTWNHIINLTPRTTCITTAALADLFGAPQDISQRINQPKPMRKSWWSSLRDFILWCLLKLGLRSVPVVVNHAIPSYAPTCACGAGTGLCRCFDTTTTRVHGAKSLDETNLPGVALDTVPHAAKLAAGEFEKMATELRQQLEGAWPEYHQIERKRNERSNFWSDTPAAKAQFKLLRVEIPVSHETALVARPSHHWRQLWPWWSWKRDNQNGLASRPPCRRPAPLLDLAKVPQDRRLGTAVHVWALQCHEESLDIEEATEEFAAMVQESQTRTKTLQDEVDGVSTDHGYATTRQWPSVIQHLKQQLTDAGALAEPFGARLNTFQQNCKNSHGQSLRPSHF